MKLSLIRHPELSSNADGICIGQTDRAARELSDEEYSSLEAKICGVRHLFSSDLCRAAEPAKRIAAALNVKLTLDAKLREINFGRWEDRKWDDIHQTESSALDLWAKDTESSAPHGGESWNDFTGRIISWNNTVLATFPRERIAAVTHAGVIRVFLASALDLSVVEASEIEVRNLSIWDFEVSESGQIKLLSPIPNV